VFGTQPGSSSTGNSPNRSALPAAEDTYVRPVSGWYGILVQDLGNIPVSAVVKYDVYDPNTFVAGDKIGASGSFTTSTDVKYTTWSLGALWRINPALRLTASYDIITNETSSSLSNTDVMKDFSKDIQDNMMTVRLQYKF
jgi:outer membrane receptor protein involved in Fe transport